MPRGRPRPERRRPNKPSHSPTADSVSIGCRRPGGSRAAAPVPERRARARRRSASTNACMRRGTRSSDRAARRTPRRTARAAEVLEQPQHLRHVPAARAREVGAGPGAPVAAIIPKNRSVASATGGGGTSSTSRRPRRARRRRAATAASRLVRRGPGAVLRVEADAQPATSTARGRPSAPGRRRGRFRRRPRSRRAAARGPRPSAPSGRRSHVEHAACPASSASSRSPGRDATVGRRPTMPQ